MERRAPTITLRFQFPYLLSGLVLERNAPENLKTITCSRRIQNFSFITDELTLGYREYRDHASIATIIR